IEHGRIEEPVDVHGARHLIELVLDRIAAERNLDHHIDVVRRVLAGLDLGKAHEPVLPLDWPGTYMNRRPPQPLSIAGPISHTKPPAAAGDRGFPKLSRALS